MPFFKDKGGLNRVKLGNQKYKIWKDISLICRKKGQNGGYIKRIVCGLLYVCYRVLEGEGGDYKRERMGDLIRELEWKKISTLVFYL